MRELLAQSVCSVKVKVKVEVEVKVKVKVKVNLFEQALVF